MRTLLFCKAQKIIAPTPTGFAKPVGVGAIGAIPGVNCVFCLGAKAPFFAAPGYLLLRRADLDPFRDQINLLRAKLGEVRFLAGLNFDQQTVFHIAWGDRCAALAAGH